MLDVLRRHTVEAEAFRLLALPEKVVQKAVQRVAVLVEQQKILLVGSRSGGRFRRAVLFQPGDDADFSRLLVPDNQHVFLILFLFHTLLLLIKNEIVSPTKVAAINRPAMGEEPCGSLWLPSGSLWLYAFCLFSPFFPSDSLKWVRRNSCTSDSL